MARPEDFLKYNPETGDFIWIEDPKTGRKMKGKVAGYYDTKGYLRVKIQGESYSLHRLAFSFMGEDVPEEVDHKDRVKDNNKWDNLRKANSTQNACNKKTQVGATGVRGVTLRPDGKYRVRVSVGGNRIHIGDFYDLELAGLIASEARHTHHKEFMYAE